MGAQGVVSPTLTRRLMSLQQYLLQWPALTAAEKDTDTFDRHNDASILKHLDAFA